MKLDHTRGHYCERRTGEIAEYSAIVRDSEEDQRAIG